MTFLKEAGTECSWWQSPLISNACPDVVHGVSLRVGGVSDHPYASLNMGLHVGDDPGRVRANRERALGSLGLLLDSSVCAEQVHGVCVQAVGRRESGRGAHHYAEALKGVDGLMTAEPNVPLLGCFADCVPLLFAEREGAWVGMAHAGWKGSYGCIALNAIQTLQTRGVDPRNLYVALGPSIQACCYEVSEALAEQFRQRFGETGQHLSDTGRPHLDLTAINVQTLVDAGVPRERIDVSADCTACNTDRYFSHRIEGPKTGRMAAIIARTA